VKITLQSISIKVTTYHHYDDVLVMSMALNGL